MDKLNNFLNVKSSISPISILLFVQIIFVSHFFQSDMSRKLKEYVESNTFLKQLIIFLTILTIISQVYPNESFINTLLISATMYFLLLFITNSDYRVHVAVFILLVVFNLYETYTKQKTKQQLADPRLEPEYKEQILENNYKIDRIIYGIMICIIVGGALYYERIKRKQFGEKFSLVKFLFS